MRPTKTKDDLILHKQKALNKLNTYMDTLIKSNDGKLNGKADKLSYWLEDWSTFLNFESEFSPLSLRRYKRGEIIKAHLGFNVGSEEGGLHYAVVLDKQNAKSSPVITVAPLTSVKTTTNLSRLKRGSVFLGNELYTNLYSKSKAINDQLENEVELLNEMLSQTCQEDSPEKAAEISRRIDDAVKELDLLRRVESEIRKMKKGSIALINQITTISKIRIYDPKTDHDILSGIRLTNESLDKIDAEILKMYMK